MRLHEVIRELQTGASKMSLTDLKSLVSQMKPDRGEIEPFIHFDEERYCRNLVHRETGFETLVLCWRPGQHSPVHDHGTSRCAVYTVEGRLSAVNYRKTAAGTVRRDSSEEVGPGAVIGTQTTDIHQVTNPDSSRDLISVHFYLGPLENYGTYEL